MGVPAVLPPTGLIGGLIGSVWSDTSHGLSTLVPDPFAVSINDRVYLHDLEFKPWKRQAMRATTTTTTRTQADTSNEPGEQSLSTESLWRRTQDSWHLGAGQVYLDRKDSSEFSFRDSWGVDPWTQWQLTLLNGTSVSLSVTSSTPALVVCGAYLYVLDGTHLRYTTDPAGAWTTVTGMPVTAGSSICSDGNSIWITCGTSGIYTTTGGAAAVTQYSTSAVSSSAVIRFVMGRLMLGTSNTIYNLTGSGPLPASPLMTSLYGAIQWVDFSVGNGVIFAAGNSGNIGVIYSIQIATDGTTLASPIVCGQLPNGELVAAIYGYAGSGVFIGTSQGWRFAEQALANDVAGTVSLTIGPLFPMDSPVRCFSGFNRFVWANVDNQAPPAGLVPSVPAASGLIRIDPSQFTADLTPAYANDIAGSDTAAVMSLVHFNGTPVYVTAAMNVTYQTENYVGYGWLDSGLITYGLADNKMPVFVDLSMDDPNVGRVDTYVSLDGAPFSRIGQTTPQASPLYEFRTPQQLSQTIELRERLDAWDSNTEIPILTRHTLRSVPAPAVPTDWNIVIQLREEVLIKDITKYYVPSDEYKYLDSLRVNKTICSVQVGHIGPLDMTIESIDWIPEQWASVSGELNGVAVLTCRTVV